MAGYDAVQTFLSLPGAVNYEDIIFILTIENIGSCLRISYKIGEILPTSKHYEKTPFNLTWNNPRVSGGSTEYLFWEDNIKGDFDLYMLSINLRQALIENDIIGGEKWDQ